MASFEQGWMTGSWDTSEVWWWCDSRGYCRWKYMSGVAGMTWGHCWDYSPPPQRCRGRENEGCEKKRTVRMETR